MAQPPTRLLDRFGEDLAGLGGDALRDAIRASEGRVVLAEVVAGAPPLLTGTANPELVAGFGADLICLNLLDPLEDGPVVAGLEALSPVPEGLADLCRLLGRPVGVNLEPGIDSVPDSFSVSPERVTAAAERGAAFVVVTANPGRGVTLADLIAAVQMVRSTAPTLLCLAGKMHHGGYYEPPGPGTAKALARAGAGGVLIPLPGTMPGLSEAVAADMVTAAHAEGALAIGTIGTSQEGADDATIRTLALTAKRIGVDVHHIGDAGLTGLARPETIYAYSVAIRGVRHTWNRIARNTRATWGGHQ